ncbi:PAS domain-containing protein [Methylobacterium planeticum]|uniref:PAS domain-containing protein n=1 Tax=Methylobacterium planeticum TaxID=2615211 RepID=A0A6N6MVZ5_9HYPH|nr:PAS domain-containing protein [Methylobacterium planeticum]KAB1073150.1 PAS domain-containing protein [Methylobacterium planeticum]
MADAPIPRAPADLEAALEASGFVGSWRHDLWQGRLALTAPFARLLGIDPERAAEGVPMAAFLDRMHPDDRTRIENHLHAASDAGGPFEAEFRTLSGREGVRSLMMRGRIEQDTSGRPVHGCGIAIDLTEDRAATLQQAERLVNRMAEHAIAMRSLVDGLNRPSLSKLVDGLMIEIGFELARHLRGAQDLRPH